ncbi:MAG: tetratricopeptide repeat protein [Flavobacterium sp.]|nr:MAG: tetratricopeptide repeat protein [Flavobacterium sp.]
MKQDRNGRYPIFKKHNIIRETTPFSYWAGITTDEEYFYEDYQNNLAKDNHKFQQADILFKSNQYDQAIAFYKQAIETYSKEPNNHKLAVCQNNIGLIYEKKGQYDEALKNLEKAFDIRLRLYGSDHVYTAYSYNNIGQVWNSMEEPDRALENFEKALQIWKRMLKCINPNAEIANLENNIEIPYRKMKKYNDALDSLARSLKKKASNIP